MLQRLISIALLTATALTTYAADAEAADGIKPASPISPATVTEQAGSSVPAAGREAEATAAYEAANGMYHDGKLQAAADSLGELVNKYPDTKVAPEALYLRGMAQAQRGETAAAIESWHNLATNYPNHPKAQEAQKAIETMEPKVGHEHERGTRHHGKTGGKGTKHRGGKSGKAGRHHASGHQASGHHGKAATKKHAKHK
ncbi:MAG: tetratricopeptide repeat protein [Burkholderiales bacterium]|nr:tetratricopeptide repeat protein [Burkholderiales bacterium]